MGVVIKAIRDSAKGEHCMFCGGVKDTVVFCHGPRLDVAGLGQKVDDWWGAYGCDECHAKVDQHMRDRNVDMVYWLRAIQRTQRRLYEKGIMTFPEKPAIPKVVSKIVPHSGRMKR